MLERFSEQRRRMVQQQIAARGIRDPRVLRAMEIVPRHRFVPPHLRIEAYEDWPLPIGEGQTISQPYIVAAMTEALQLHEDDRVLEIGTGSGYQTAVLAELAEWVYTIECIGFLQERALRLLDSLGYRNIEARVGDGHAGWPEAAPYQAILVTAAPPEIPAALAEQLAVGGRMLVPIGSSSYTQTLVRLRRTASGIEREELFSVRFVPLVRP
ncbi:MAG: protein-L-isoaspartate(D-aspartate) O-methyltransferase [Deltaproteobacteria bacterium]|nr:protein-L-isoaspartate(D-aspartate) O-methyltransferase [Deltaproteobacteria bacterium]